MYMSESKMVKTIRQTTENRPIIPLRSPGKLQALKRTDRVLRCRYELKYRIPETKARAIASYIRSYIPVDRYSQDAPDLQYFISSLYFDSKNLHLCKETINKKANRFKLRIRCYDDNPETPCFVEIKRRVNNVILKDRTRLSKDDLTRVVEEMYVPASLYKQDKKTLQQFQFYLRVLNARPIHLVRYKRQAFEGTSSNRVRVTFDRDLCFKRVVRPELTVNGNHWHTVPMDFVILEIKFTDRYPLWLSDLVKIFDLKQTAMSKYASSVKQSCSMGFCAPINT